MLLKDYEQKALLCNVSVNGACTKPDTFAFRGDLVLEEGDIADAEGRRKPPKSVLKQAVLLVDRDKMSFVAGTLAELELLPFFAERYRPDFAGGMKVLFYVENLGKPLLVEYDGVGYILIPHEDGAVWNTLMDDLRLDKDDFKGQSAEDKLITMAAAVHDFKPKYASASYEQALELTVEVKREARGPV